MSLEWNDFKPEGYRFEYVLLYRQGTYDENTSTWELLDVSIVPLDQIPETNSAATVQQSSVVVPTKLQRKHLHLDVSIVPLDQIPETNSAATVQQSSVVVPKELRRKHLHLGTLGRKHCTLRSNPRINREGS